MQQKKQKHGMATILSLCTHLAQFSYVVGGYYFGTGAGSFAFDHGTGAAYGSCSFRVVLVP